MYLIDTVVFSELFKRRRHPGVVRWYESKSDDLLFVSAVTIGEVERGIERQRGHNDSYADALTAWLESGILTYGRRILPITTEIARLWGRLSAQIGHDGPDILIAATALEHGLVVATRNVRHFAPTGVPVENPYEC